MISTIGAFNTINWKKIYPNVTYLLYYQFDSSDLSTNNVGNRRNLWNNISNLKIYDAILFRSSSMTSGLYLDLSANDYMQITTIPDFKKEKGWTIAYWLLSKNNGTNTPIFELNSSNTTASNLIANYVDSSGLRIVYNDISNSITDISFNKSTWNHIISSVDGNTISKHTYYVNGIYKGTNNVTLSNISRTSNYIGKTSYTGGPNGTFVGSIGHFIVYNKNFKSSDALTLYNSYFTPIYMDIVGFTQSFAQNSITLSFKSPNNNILKYRFTFNPILTDPATGNNYFDISYNLRSFTFTGMASNTNYTITGFGIGTYGNTGAVSVNFSTLNSLGNITSLTYAYYAPQNYSTVDISYNAVEGADNYYVSTDGVNYISVGNYLSYTLQNLNASTNYTVSVYASNVGGSTSALSTVSFFTKGPAQLSNLTFNVTQTTSTVTFVDLGYDTQTFEVTTPNGFTSSLTPSPIYITDLSNGSVYNVYINAVGLYGNTVYDNSFVTVPLITSAVATSSSTGTISFVQRNGYIYDLSSVITGGTTLQSTNISSPFTYSVGELQAGRIYTTKLTAIYGTLRSPTHDVSFITYTVAPIITSVVYDVSASLTFVNTPTIDVLATDFSAISLTYSVRNGGGSSIVLVATSSPIIIDLSESTVYDISAISYYKQTRSDLSFLSITTFPTPPATITATATSSSTSTVNFTPNTSLSYGYDISAVPASGSIVFVTNISGGSIPYSFTGLIPSMRYNMSVYAKSPITGLKSQYARTGNVVTYTVAPTINVTTIDTSASLIFTNTFNATYAGNFVSLDASYTAPSITGYYVVALDTSGTPVNTYTITTTLPVTNYNFTGLSPFTLYTFRIYSVYNGQNSTSYYDISAITNPSAPDGLSTRPVSQTSVELSFNMLSGFTYNARFGVTNYLGVSSPYVFTGLSSSSVYTFELQRTSLGLSSVYASIFGYTKTPPITFSYSNILDTYVDISYVLNNTATTGSLSMMYIYYSARDSGITNTATSVSTTGTRVTGLVGSTLYDISLVAVYVNTLSDPAGGTLQTAPPAPTGLIATVNGTSSITISYDSLQSVSYDVSAVSTAGNLSSTSISNPYTFTGLTTAMLYTIYLYPVISGVKGTPAVTTGVTYTAAPSVVSSVTDVSASFAITPFTANASTGALSRNVVTYSIRGAGSPIDVSSAISPIILDGLVESTIYDISVVSLYANTRSLTTSTSVTTYPTPPATITATTLSDTTANVSFTTTSNYAYDVSAVPSSGSTIGITDISGTQIPYIFTGLSSGTRYTMYVFAKSPTTLLKSLYSRASNAIVTYTAAPTVTSTVTDVSASLAITSFANADTGALSRNVVTYSVRGIGAPTDVSSAISPIILNGLTESTIYDISVVSLYANTISLLRSLFITTYPSVPTDTTATTLSSTSLSVNFTPNTSLNYTYDISGPTSATSVTGINGSSLPYTFTGLTSGTRYTFFIFAISPATTLRYNNKSSVNTITYVLAPYSLATNNMTSISLDLSYSVYTPTDAGAFTAVDISYAVRGIGTQTLVSSSANNKYSFTGLSAITIYDISLVARYANTRSEIASYSFTTLLPTPTYSIATRTTNSIDISFEIATDVVYDISAIRGVITGSSIVGATTSPQSFTGLVNAGLYTINMFARSIAASTTGVKSLVYSSTAYTLANAVTPTVNANGYYLNINYSTSAQNDSGTFGNVAITYKTGANAQTTVNTTNTSPYNLTGLTPSTTYDISFVANYANTSAVTYFNSYTTLSQPTAPTITNFSYANNLFTTTWTNNATQRTKNVVYIYNNSNVLQHTSPDLLASDVSYSTGAITTSGTYYSRVSVFNQDLSSVSLNSNVFNKLDVNLIRYYSFNSQDINVKSILNKASQIYDASLSDTYMFSNSSKVEGDGSLVFNDTSNNYVNLNSTNLGGNISITSWIRPNNTKSHSTLFNFDNGKGYNTLGMYIVGNSLVTNVIDGSLSINDVSLIELPNMFGSTTTTDQGSDEPGSVLNGSYYVPNTNMILAVSNDERKLLISDSSYGYIYYSAYNISNSTWGPFIRTYGKGLMSAINQGFYVNCMSITSNGSRGVITDSTGIFYFDWVDSSNNYSELTKINVQLIFTDISISANGERIAVSGSSYGQYYGYYLDWNSLSQSYGQTVTFSTLNIRSVLVRSNLNLFYISGSNIYYRIWNKNTKSYSPQTAISNTLSNSRVSLSYDDNVIFLSQTGTGTFYISVWNNDTKTYTVQNSINTNFARYFAAGNNITTTGNIYVFHNTLNTIRIMNVYFSKQRIYSFSDIDIKNTSNSWKNITWTISQTGTYKYYLDASLVYTRVNGIILNTVTRTNNYIGTNYILDNSFGFMNYFNGGIDNFAIYNKELTQTDISNIYLNP